MHERLIAAGVAIVLLMTTSRAGAEGKPHTDFNAVPVVGGSTDIGWGGGAVFDLSRSRPGVEPFEWDLQGNVLATARGSDTGRGLESPYLDAYATLTLSRAFHTPLMLTVRPSYTSERTLDYFGLGNASPPQPSGTPNHLFEYGRTHPQILVTGRLPLVGHLSVKTGFRYTGTWLDIPADTKLAQDLRSGSPEVRSLLGRVADRGVFLLRYGLGFDTRDDQTSSHRGTFDEVELKLSPGGTDALPYRYGQATVRLRAYVPVGPRVVLAGRLVGDVLFGQPPFYELCRFDDTYALGGTDGVRGIPAQRYYGKRKLFGNAEVRVDLLRFSALGKRLLLGAVAFADAGRLWADGSSQPALDGTGIGLHYGVGSGIRLQSGKTFVVRLDVAWSPDATPVAGYFAAGQTF